jgi:dienelactone hydrolase
MAEVLLFHHVHGLTSGVEEFAAGLREAGHLVHAPDLFEGRTFDDIPSGLAHVQELGFGTVIERGAAVAQQLPERLVYAGFSMGVLPAQMLAQTRAGATGALLMESCVPVPEFGPRWPEAVPVQVHGMDDDWSFVGEGDIEAARALVDEASDGELFLYPGDRHLFADPSLPTYDPEAAALLTERVLAFLQRVG